MKCQICHKEADVVYQCEITGRIACEACEKAVIKTKWGYVTSFPCFVHENHEHKRIPSFLEVEEQLKQEEENDRT